jgi:SWI/SNF-related matrix-associated actin-dependent regulator 1 of chromatin subfamily A
METLLPYQEEGARWLASRKFALLGDQMRLGKTPQSIRAADLIDAKPILVLCPAVARMNWDREFKKFSTRTLSIGVLLNGKTATKESGKDAVVCSYDLIQNAGVRRTLSQRNWQLIILDESHYLKSPEAKRTTSVLGKSGLCTNAARVWALSGTPAPNNASELWVMLRVFGVYAGSYDQFVREFCTGFNGPYGFQITGAKNADKLREMLKPIMLRRTRKEVSSEYTEPRYSDVVVEPSELHIADLESAFPQNINVPNGWKNFKTEMTALEAELDAAIVNPDDSESVLRLLSSQIPHVASLRRYIGLLKVPAVVELVKQELDAGLQKIVIFAIHKQVVENLRVGLKEYDAVTLYGGTDPAKRDRNIKRFQENPKCRVFIGNIAACGIAIDLSAASDVLFVEADWVPMNNSQAAARVDNLKQTNTICVRFVGLAGSIDEHVQRTLQRKTNELSKIFDVRGGANLAPIC